MKYMQFNSSCSYAALANLLEQHGIDTEDTEIALEMQLPYLFAREDGCFHAGPMLQGKPWFDCYLRPHGLRFQETAVCCQDVPEHLREPCMLGLDGHAVVFLERHGDRYRFLNPKWKHGTEPEYLTLFDRELRDRLAETVHIGEIINCEKGSGTGKLHLLHSAEVLRELQTEIGLFCAAPRTMEEQRTAMNRLFRPILLDGVTMLGLIGKNSLKYALTEVQTAYLQQLRDPTTTKLPLQKLWYAMDAYRALILEKSSELQ